MILRDVILLLFSLTICSQIKAKSLCLAHRGGHIIHGENSIAAIRHSLKIGADGVEVDLRHTSDGIGIGVHDIVLWRVAYDKPGKKCPKFTFIETLTLEDIRSNCYLKKSVEIATFEEILNEIQRSNSILLFQLKDIPTQNTVRLVKNFKGKVRLRVHSFWDSYLDKFEELSALEGFKIDALKLSKYIPRFNYKRGNDLWWPFHWFFKWDSKLKNQELGC